MPHGSERQRRNRAIVSLQALCALRVSELRTVRLKNLIEEEGSYFIYVCPKDMQVKFAKTRHAVFIPLPGDIIANVLTWRDELRMAGFGRADPLFPRIDSRFTQAHLLERSLKKEAIRSDGTIRGIFRRAFEAAGFAYINPHSFRKTLARYAQTQSPAFLNAVRQNLGHESIDTTLTSYGSLSTADQQKIIASSKVQIEGI